MFDQECKVWKTIRIRSYGGKGYPCPCPCPFVLVCPFVLGFFALPSIGTSQGQTGFLMCDHRLNSRNTVHFDANIFKHGCLNLILNPSLVWTCPKNAFKSHDLKKILRSKCQIRMFFLKKLLDHHKKHVFLSLKFKKIVFLLSVCPWAKNALFACPLSTSFQTKISWTCPFVPEPKIRLRDIPSYRMVISYDS